MKSFFSSCGFSLLELVLAIAIFSLGSVALTTLLIDSNLSTKLSTERLEALFYAKEGIEAVRSIRDSDWSAWSALSDGDYGLTNASGDWAFNGNSETIEDKYTRVVNLTTNSYLASTTKDATVTVSWALTPSHESSVVLTTMLTNWTGVGN